MGVKRKLIFDGVVFSWNPNRGIPRMYRAVLPLLCKAQPELELVILVPRGKSLTFPDFTTENVDFVYYGVALKWRPWRLWARVSAVLTKLHGILLWWLSRGDFYLSPFYQFMQCPGRLITVVHDMMPELFPEQFDSPDAQDQHWRKYRAIENASRIICISQSTLADVVRLTGVSRSICRVALHGVDRPERIEEPMRGAGSAYLPFVLYVGGVSFPYKNFDRVVQCMQHSTLADYSLVVVGPESEDSPRLRSASAKLGVERLRYYRGLGDSELWWFYENCAVFVFPSLYEGFGLPILEALSCGAPVACSNAASMPEVGGDCCVYFDPEDIDSMISAIGEAIKQGRSDEQVAKRLNHIKQFSWFDTVNVLSSCFDEIPRDD